jgi:hypothetical protein
MKGPNKLECLFLRILSLALQPGAKSRGEAALRKAPALPANIRLGWTNLPGTNTLAYLVHSQISKKKVCIILTPALGLSPVFPAKKKASIKKKSKLF